MIILADQRHLSLLLYRFLQLLARLVSFFLYRCRVLRNEIREVQGPFVVIANHETALDFVNLIPRTRQPMRFVISSTMYHQLPFRDLDRRLGLIHKQQFQTKVSDLKQMRQVIKDGQPLVIYPAGIMPEDGMSTPIPDATFRFLRWIDADIYAARSSGAYLVMPKWAPHVRPGRSTIDIYRLISREELKDMDEAAIKAKVEAALHFDTYREAEARGFTSPRYRSVQGLEYVLYQCPCCKSEYSVTADHDTLSCAACGYKVRSDRGAILHRISSFGPELPYVTDWSSRIREDVRRQLQSGALTVLESHTRIQLLYREKHHFLDAGEGILRLTRDGFTLKGTLNGAPLDLQVPLNNLPTIPCKPGRHLELQQGDTTYRCIPDQLQVMMKYVNMLELLYEDLSASAAAADRP